jgi:hypothetical protein
MTDARTKGFETKDNVDSYGMGWGHFKEGDVLITFYGKRNTIIVDRPFGDKLPTDTQRKDLERSTVFNQLLEYAIDKKTEKIVTSDPLSNRLLTKLMQERGVKNIEIKYRSPSEESRASRN